jgi:hypothetical protein
MALQPFVGLWPLLQFRNLFYTDGRTPWTGDQPVARPLPTQRTTQTQNKRIYKHTCLEPMIPVFKRAKTFHALDRAATVIGFFVIQGNQILNKHFQKVTELKLIIECSCIRCRWNPTADAADVHLIAQFISLTTDATAAWVRIPHKALMFRMCMHLFCFCVVLCLDRDLPMS